jgi:hypothetical protein
LEQVSAPLIEDTFYCNEGVLFFFILVQWDISDLWMRYKAVVLVRTKIAFLNAKTFIPLKFRNHCNLILVYSSWLYHAPVDLAICFYLLGFTYCWVGSFYLWSRYLGWNEDREILRWEDIRMGWVESSA